MLFKKSQLAEILRLAQPAIQDVTALPALQYVCFRNGKAMATNLQLTIMYDTGTDFTGLLPHRLLNAIISVCESESISIEEQEKTWILTDGKSVHKLGKSEPIENFPAEPLFNAENEIQFNDAALFHLQNAAKFEGVKTAGAEGCYIGKDIVGTNGTFIYKFGLGADCSLHIPSLFVKAIGNNFGTLQYSERFVGMKAGTCTYITTQLEAKYPGYARAFEQFPIAWNVSVSRETLQNEIKKVMAYAPEIPVAGFEFSGIWCNISYKNDFEQEYKNDFPCQSGYAGELRLNLTQLQTILSCFTEPEIEIAIAAPNRSVYLREKNNNNTITLIQPSK